MSAIELKALTKRFPSRDGKGDVNAVDNVSLSVRAGEFICLLGPSGCGKTTALRCLAGFEHPTSGSIWVGGRDVTRVPAHRRNLPLVFQNYALFPHLTVFDNIAYGLRIKRTSAAEIQRRVAAVAAQLHLEGLGNRHPDQLSGGQQQRVALARALVLQPLILLFDEPLCNLDAKLRVAMRLEIKKLQQTLGLTAIYVTHDQEEAMSLADRIVVMRGGRIEQEGTPMAIYERPINRFVADFIGRANFVEGRVASVNGPTCTVEALGVRCQAVCADPQGMRPGDAVTLMIRYEAISPAVNAPANLTGRVNHIVYLGERALYELAVGTTTLFMQIANPQEQGRCEPGQIIGLTLHHKGLVALPTEGTFHPSPSH